jgi:hypothetical protein
MAQSESTSSALTLSIQTRVQLLAGFEERSDLAQDIDRRTRSRVPAGVRISIFDRESTEAADLSATGPARVPRRFASAPTSSVAGLTQEGSRRA